MTEPTLIVFDTETTGFPKPSAGIDAQPRIIEFAAIKVDRSFKEVGRLDFLCGSPEPLHPKITEITKLTDDDLVGKPLFAEHEAEVHEFFTGTSTVMAHNLKFDIQMMVIEGTRGSGWETFPWPKHERCSMLLTEHLERRWLKLHQLYDYASPTPMVKAHRAMVDVEALVIIAKWMREEGIF